MTIDGKNLKEELQLQQEQTAALQAQLNEKLEDMDNLKVWF